jgi:hypothetical protein
MHLDAFGHYKSAASKLLLEHGMGKKGPDGLVEFDPNAWYPLDANLRCLAAIGAQAESILHQAGKLIPKHFPFPPQINDVPSVLKTLDVAYHMNHRLRGVVMFDPATGKLLDGIGHYTAELGKPGEATVFCDNPYPCALDRGLLFGVIRRFAARATVDHVGDACRAKGATACTYRVSWGD